MLEWALGEVEPPACGARQEGIRPIRSFEMLLFAVEAAVEVASGLLTLGLLGVVIDDVAIVLSFLDKVPIRKSPC